MHIKSVGGLNLLVAYPPGKPGKVREFDVGQGKVREIIVFLQCVTAIAIVMK